MQNNRLLNCLKFQYVCEGLFPRSPLPGILGKMQFLCALCLSGRSSKSEAWRLGGHLFRISANETYL